MSNLSITDLIALSIAAGFIPATVEAKAQGETVILDVASFHPETIAAVFTYGARRMLQDHVNSAAHQHKASDAKDEFDAPACIAARIAAFNSGTIGQRASGGETFTREDDELYALVIGLRGNSAWGPIATAYSLSKGLSTAERKRAVLTAFESMPDAAKAQARTAVADKIARDDALASLSF